MHQGQKKSLLPPNSNDLIEHCLTLKPYNTTHLLCCTNKFVLIDERFPKRALLTWKHDLKQNSLLNLKQIYLFRLHLSFQNLKMNNFN
jgi:hypothetical protein